MRISAAAPARVTQPTYEKLKAQLATLDKKIATASKALQDHKDIMMRSRYTPEGLKLATAKLKSLEKDLAKLQTQRKQLVAQMAVIRPSTKPPTAAALTAAVERHLKAGDLEFGAKAPKKEDILTQTSVHKHPFTYTAIVLKNDPTRMIVKKVLTGGFVPAKPGDGTYSKPVSIKP
ncbi:MAG: hypothetical protein Q8S33_25285 [Myxococcales bacterium]|nr:hypothetical protein [Myxococcales bacterium]MDP3503674.1 hypothetical protein [Myxococcales bacterium]